MPSFPIVDSHVHLYDPAHLRYSWLGNVPKINRRYDLADFDRCRDGVEVDKIVFAEVWVDPGLHLEEAAWVQDLADNDPRLAGMVAHAPLEKGPAVEADLEKLKRFRITKGIRRLIEIEMDPRICLEPGFLDALRLLPKHGLTFDICVKHWQLAFGLELVKRCPDVSFVLDHIGKPGIKHGMWEPWKTQIRELSRMPNIVVKVSGVVTEADHQGWTKDQVKPYVDARHRLLRLRPLHVRQRLDGLGADPPVPGLGRDPGRGDGRRQRGREAELLARDGDQDVPARVSGAGAAQPFERRKLRCQLSAPVLLSLPQQNAPSGPRAPSRRPGGPWRARHSHDRRDRPPARRTDRRGAAHPP